MLDQLTAGDFTPLTNTDFTLAAGDGGIVLRLVEIGLYPRSGVGSRAEPFSLFFESDADRILPQSIYRLDHPSMATLEIFLVPVGRRNGRTRYEAAFN